MLIYYNCYIFKNTNINFFLYFRLSYVHLSGQDPSDRRRQLSKGRHLSLLQQLPWDGLVYLGASGSGILATVLLSSTNMVEQQRTTLHDLYLVTFYVAFAPVGILDIIAFFKKGLKCERLLKTFALGTALCVHAALFIIQARHGRMADVLLMAAIVISVIAAFAGFLAPQAHIVLGLSMTVQGTWLLQMSSSEAVEEGSEWVTIYFAWHLLVVSFIYTVLLLLKERRENLKLLENDQDKFASLKSKTSNTSTQLTEAPPTTNAIEEGIMNDSFLRKQMPVYNSNSSAIIPSGLIVLPDQATARDKAATLDECQVSVASSSNETASHQSHQSHQGQHHQLRRTEIRTSLKPRHSTTTNNSPALSQAVTNTSSPAPSTASTALSHHTVSETMEKAAAAKRLQQQQQQIRQLQQKLHQDDEQRLARLHQQNHKEEQQSNNHHYSSNNASDKHSESQSKIQDSDTEQQDSSAVYENTILGQPKLSLELNRSIDLEHNPVYSSQEETAKPSIDNITAGPNTVVNRQSSIDSPAVVECEPFDRISPIDEYNTLSRHVQSVRASIKLKESGFI